MLLDAHRIRANEEGEANDTVSALEEDLNRAVILDHSQVLPLRRVDVADYAHLLQVERRCQLISELKIDGPRSPPGSPLRRCSCRREPASVVRPGGVV